MSELRGQGTGDRGQVEVVARTPPVPRSLSPVTSHFDVLVVGGGTAGLVTASGCARDSRRVALVERAALGGDCLWTGCVPTKSLVASAKLLHQIRNSTAFGLEPLHTRAGPRAIMESMRERRRLISRHDDPEKFRKLGIEVIEGNATLTTANVVEVNGRQLTAKDIVLATGSRTAVPPVDGLEEHGYLDHASFLDRDDFPRSLLILGGGPIGIEFAQLFRRFGCDVVVVEMADEIIAKEDAEVVAAVRAILREEGVEIRTGWGAKSVRVEDGKKVVRIETQRGGGAPRRRDLRRLRPAREHRRLRGIENEQVVRRRRQIPADLAAARLGLRRRARRPAVHARRRVRGGEARAQHALSRQVGRRLRARAVGALYRPRGWAHRDDGSGGAGEGWGRARLQSRHARRRPRRRRPRVARLRQVRLRQARPHPRRARAGHARLDAHRGDRRCAQEGDEDRPARVARVVVSLARRRRAEVRRALLPGLGRRMAGVAGAARGALVAVIESWVLSPGS